MEQCNLCPRGCKVDRNAGTKGVCGQTNEVKAARAALHMWEEPCISGKKGSGAVFFSGCALHCAFCQNKDIANGEVGKVISVERLSEIFYELQNKGANNINLVTPGQFVPQIIRAVERARSQGMHLPIVYNTSSYESLDTIKSLEGIVDVYLPDLKYMDSSIAMRYAKAPDYFTHASRAIQEMVRQTGKPVFYREEQKEGDDRKAIGGTRYTAEEYNAWSEQSAESGKLLIRRGVIVRHLLLPTHLKDSKDILKYLHHTYGDQIYISMMNQYTPVLTETDYPELLERVSPEAYDNLISYAQRLGIENGFFQEGDTQKESFIPAFTGEGL